MATSTYIRDKAKLIQLRREYENIIEALDDPFQRGNVYLDEIQRRSEALMDFELEFFERYPRYTWQHGTTALALDAAI